MILMAPHGGGGVGGGSWWQWPAEKVVGINEKSSRNSRTAGERASPADHGWGFGRNFEDFDNLIEIQHELGFIVGIASFQLA